MGRQRLRQRQSGRIYFQGYDHREIVADGEYYNGIYLNQDVEPKWRKYKKQTLFYHDTYGVYSTFGVTFSVDTKNKFISRSREGENMATMLGDYVGGYQYVSKNGYDFKYCDWNISDYEISIDEYHRWCGNYPCGIYSTGRRHVVGWAVIDYKEGTRTGEIKDGGKKVLETTDSAYMNIAGDASDGCFAYWQFRNSSGYHFELYHVNSSGFNLVYTDDWTGTANRVVPKDIYYHGGQYIASAPYRTSSSPYMQGVRLWTSNDGNTWTQYDLIPSEPATSTRVMGCLPIYRNGTWYLYVERYVGSSAYYWELYTTTDLSTFTQVSLPDYLDVPMLDYEDGIHGDIALYNGLHYVRLILNNYTGTIPPSDDVYVVDNPFANMGINEGYWDIQDGEVADGHIRRDCQNLFVKGWVTPYNSSTHQSEMILWYIDNMTFQSSSGNFAMYPVINGEILDNESTHEYVADDDYVWGNQNNG